MSKVKITLVKSTIDRVEGQKRTVRALGFTKLNQTVEKEATPIVAKQKVVEEKGEEVTNFNIGDKVYSRVSGDQPGTFAEFIAIDCNLTSHMPNNLSFKEASSLPLVGLTTIQSFEKAGLKANDRILIHAGSGGIGTFAIQYAKSKGAFVYTTTSTNNVEWVKELGADVVIDYKKDNLVIVIGGDGFMLETLKKNKNSKKKFYGINSGNYGFLMNKFSSENIIKNLLKANMISISPLEMIVKNKNNQIKKSLAINEVSVLRQSRQAASLSIKHGSKQIIKNLCSYFNCWWFTWSKHFVDLSNCVIFSVILII